MSSIESSPDHARDVPCKLEPQSPPHSDDEPTNLVINIKEEPADEEYREEYHDNREIVDEISKDHQQNNGEHVAETEAEYYKEINIPQIVVAPKPEINQTKMVLSPCISVPLANGGSLRPIKSGRGTCRDLSSTPTPPPITSTRLVPVNIKASGPIPIALTLSKPEVDTKTNTSTLDSQAQAHHLMTLATEADKILKKQEKQLRREEGMSSDHTAKVKLCISEEDNMCSSSDSSGAGIDSFLNTNDQTLTLIQRRAAEASLSSTKKTKRKRSQLPDDMKDETYWERRRKNNEAAKRSRDARRAKEDQIAIRAALLEQENMRLRIEVAALKEETVRLKGLLYEK
ncbi:protein giant-like isoform X2 [Acanthaster planci]|nr:protein giant-like isoform X2 [Acanthaster planci]